MKKMKFLFVIPFVLCYITSSFAQVELDNYYDHNGPKFFFDFSTLGKQQSSDYNQIEFYLEIVYDELQFLKVGDGYEASYEVSIIFKDDDGDQVDGHILKETINVENYDDTNRRDKFSKLDKTFELEPGEYEFSINLQDLESESSSKLEGKFKVKKYNEDKIDASEIVFIQNIKPDSTGNLTYTPQVTNTFKGLVDTSMAYFEIYNPQNLDQVKIEYVIDGDKTKIKIKKEYTKKLDGYLTKEFIPIPVDSLIHDKYKLEIKIQGKDDVKIEKNFYARWRELPQSAKDLDTAIEQIKYISTKKEWQALKKAKGNKKLEEYKKFWKRHDPTPGTELNEAMEAHYQRIDFANQNFSVMRREGWKTDMGMIYILLGAPDDIDRNAYPQSTKPYELWYYYWLNRRFDFMDYSGFGDYRLIDPLSIYEIQRYLR